MVGTITASERVVETDALASVAALAARHQLGANLLLVCDDTTWLAAGQRLQQLLTPHFEVMPHSLGRSPRALVSHVEPILVSARAHEIGALLAVGSGTVNDVTKLAAHRLGASYFSIATAASMNGYSSATASLEEDGQKRSYPASAPKAVIADLRIIADAPRRMARAGLGDTLCRSTVAADRYLSHVVLGTPFEREIFIQLRAHEAWLMANAPLLKEGAIDYMRHLTHALLDAGDAMHATGSSAIASQGEHMIAHTMEMMYGAELRDILHGEMIAVTASSMAHLQHKLLLSQPVLKSQPRDVAQFSHRFGKAAGARLAESYARKALDEAQVAALNQRMEREWNDIKADMLELIVPANGIERAYVEAALATKPKDLGLNEDRYRAAVSYAHLTRDRFTFLDLAAMNARRVT